MSNNQNKTEVKTEKENSDLLTKQTPQQPIKSNSLYISLVSSLLIFCIQCRASLLVCFWKPSKSN